MRSFVPQGLGGGAPLIEDTLDHVVDRVRRAVGLVRAQRLLASATLGARVCATGHVQVENEGRVVIGGHTTLLGGIVPSRLRVAAGAELLIGERVIFNYGVSISAASRVEIGNGCMFGSYVRIDDGADGGPAPIVLEDEVWVAHGATIAPGVRIGARSVVSAGSTVTNDVPPDSLAIGAPARCMRLELLTQQSEKGAANGTPRPGAEG